MFLFCVVVQVLLIKNKQKNHPHIGWFSVWCTRKDPYAMHPDSLTASGSELSPKNSTLYCFLNGSSLPEVQVLLIKMQNKKSHYRGTSCFGAPERTRMLCIRIPSPQAVRNSHLKTVHCTVFLTVRASLRFKSF